MTVAVTYAAGATDAGTPLVLTDVGPVGPPGRGQVQVQVTLFPVHPGDLMVAPSGAPFALGHEATGVITQVGAGVQDLAAGSRVTVFPYLGAWQELINVDAQLAVPVPDHLPDEVAAQMLCNPLTALQLRRAAEKHASVGYDGVIVNNAAASAVGRLFTAGTRHHHIDTISVVRSEQRARELAELFPSTPVVSTSHADWVDRVRAAADGRPIPVVLDPVGGPSLTDMISLLSPGGSVIVYGALEPASFSVHASALVPDEFAIRGLSIGRWLTAVPEAQRRSDLNSARLIASNRPADFTVAGVYPVSEIGSAAKHLVQAGKAGTVLVRF